MGILNDISENLQNGKAKIVKELVQQALDEGIKPADILEQGLLAGIAITGGLTMIYGLYLGALL